MTTFSKVMNMPAPPARLAFTKIQNKKVLPVVKLIMHAYLKEESIAIFSPERYLKMNQSNTAIKWLSYVMKENNTYIEHVRNGGEKRIGKYSVDGYCEENDAFIK